MKKIFILGLVVLLTACSPNTEDHPMESEQIENVTDTETETEAEQIIEPITMDQTGYSLEDSYVSEPVTFVWEEVGFGGDFVVTLEPFNTFQMCEGPLSSTIYRGYFDVDGDIVTLRDSATSEGFKNFRFQINDDRTELTFIADGSDSLPFCQLEDGALFSTEFHHDISEYWESESKQDDSGDSDVIPAIMVNGELYFSTGEESSVTGRCGNMDGTITSTVNASAYPVKDNQSNFGAGAGYQYGTEEGTIEVYMAEGNNEGRWIVFKKRSHSELPDPELGIDGFEMEVTSASDESLVLKLANYSGKEIEYGSEYSISKIVENGLESVPFLPGEYAFKGAAYVLHDGEEIVQNIDFSILYGTLQPGTYRIYKTIRVYDSPVTEGFTSHEYYADFNIN